MSECLECKGTGQVESHIRLAQEARKDDAARRLLTACFAQGELNGMSDARVAELLRKYVYENFNSLAPMAVIINAAIARLERAGGGPCPVGDDDDDVRDR